MSDYTSFSWRAADLGLDVRDAPDKVSEGKWVKLENTRPTQEALLSTRKGLTQTLDFGTGGVVHSIKRLDPSTLLIGVGEKLFHNGTAYTYNGSTNILSGDPLSIIPFRPEVASEVWGYIADRAAMLKVTADGRVFGWGIGAPAMYTTAGISGTGGLDSTVPGAVGYDWRYTYYSSETGTESNGSPIAPNKVSAPSGSGANVNVVASSDLQVDSIRLYRRGGTITGEWRLSVTGGNFTGILRDENSDQSIATSRPLPTENEVPFPTVAEDGSSVPGQKLPYAAGPFLGKYIIACGDPNRPGYASWTTAGNPDGTSSSFNVQVTSPAEPLIGICLFSSLPYVISRDNFHALDFGQQSVTFRPRKTAVGRGMVAPWAFAIGQAIWFVSQDGIYETDGESPAKNISDVAIRPIFQGVSTGSFQAIDFTSEENIRLYYVGQELHFLYKDTGGNRQHLIWNSVYDRWRSSSSSLYSVNVTYGDENQVQVRNFSGTRDGKLVEDLGTTDNGTPITVSCRTGSIDLEQPGLMKEWGNIIMDADPGGGTINITPYLNAETSVLPTIPITGVGRQKFARTLGDTFSHSLAFDFQWTGSATIYQFTVLFRPDEEAVRHWEFPPTSHGLTGWQHIRDGYVTVRSLAPLTFSIEVDGVSFTPVFRASSSTGGEKRKLYFDMPPTKGKLFRYIIDSASDFRLYGDDCEVRVKPWNTSMGYQPVSPFKKEVALGQQG